MTKKVGRVTLASKKSVGQVAFLTDQSTWLRHFAVHMKNFCYFSLTSAGLVLLDLTRLALIYLSPTAGIPAWICILNHWRARLIPCSAIGKSPANKVVPLIQWQIRFISYNKSPPVHWSFKSFYCEAALQETQRKGKTQQMCESTDRTRFSERLQKYSTHRGSRMLATGLVTV